MLAGYTIVYTILVTTALLLLRRSLQDASLTAVLQSPRFYLGFAFYALSFLTFLFSLRRFEVLTVYPLFTGLAYAAVTVAAVLVLGENMTPVRVAAIALIGAGVVLLAR
jgi:multidrug transporter EmrE-like cation transporter